MLECMQVEKPFTHVCLGGTFDHIHDGHRELLKTAIKMGARVSIGLATDALLKHKKFKESMLSYAQREKEIRAFLMAELRVSKEDFTIFPLNDPFGPAIIEPGLDAMICSAETYRGCIEINKIRLKNEIPPLTIVIIPITLNASGKKLSSTDIRANLQKRGIDE